ncbi:MAG: hypothetical protein COT91_05185 [Candidatus Doudnabacteria bacterium CG10_big_fil_rev_8_21_14_0_10_41_10]|uniref:Rod shape-determining protein MreD n=1 Tax=Candidatus Doudnabacteria bacterium CG10_big_fil_rev_8_21_14_0_10_41_10 TaxID=1974551 RepID=A0A2H0VEL3_9BACT|nr:MAG: hypothetical protein COT91_05185 [Candidatus Doudnabacteria bacterium CG10_big_fil_rev_8_21_14_0_10_41_10]
MTRTVIFFLVVIVIQIILSNLINFTSSIPNLFLILAAWIALFRQETDYIFIPAVGGIFLDLYSPDFFGFNFLLLFAVVVLLKRLVRMFVRPNPDLYVQIGFTFFAILIFNLIGAIFYSILESLGLVSGHFMSGFLNLGLVWEIIYSLLLAVPIGWIAGKMLVQTDIKKFGI